MSGQNRLEHINLEETRNGYKCIKVLQQMDALIQSIR